MQICCRLEEVEEVCKKCRGEKFLKPLPSVCLAACLFTEVARGEGGYVFMGSSDLADLIGVNEKLFAVFYDVVAGPLRFYMAVPRELALRQFCAAYLAERVRAEASGMPMPFYMFDLLPPWQEARIREKVYASTRPEGRD
ncbi:hypothetical protein ODS41_09985 [Pyrobaculum sp. 3827-6]|uniref:hypothetical protein n=1 Tax=Pyrobaculum sp. 3827-6 TaxID=2983604 RepID=UPI0021D98ECD|nr:hypothetical protein [Pyrobaculum sp. 3827-6]MCU7788239.1 hypothetical protein [Pyrobaculum sp. 3827-6]